MKERTKGIVAYACVLSLYQDIVYKDAQTYANYILNGGWTDRAITIPLAILGLILVSVKRSR